MSEIKQTGERERERCEKGQTKQGATTWGMGGTDIQTVAQELIIIKKKLLVECNLVMTRPGHGNTHMCLK
jgi:hypothetical protein